VPLGGILTKVGASEIGALPLDRAQPLQIESDRRIAVVARCHELAGESACRPRLAQAIKHPAAFTKAVEKTGFAQQLQMAGNPRLALPEDLRQLADGELTAGAQDDEPQSGRLGHRAQRSQ
jgi:hypothetical protein